MKSPLGLSLWFISCVSIGLFMAWVDGVDAKSLLEAGLIASGAALLVAVLVWAVKTGKVDRNNL
jgi:membrane protein DedA with SNARE-associated domain